MYEILLLTVYTLANLGIFVIELCRYRDYKRKEDAEKDRKR
jgi:hypothetical protein